MTFKPVRIQTHYTPRLIARPHALMEVIRLVSFTGGGPTLACLSSGGSECFCISEKYLCGSCQTEGNTHGCVTFNKYKYNCIAVRRRQKLWNHYKWQKYLRVCCPILLLHLLSDGVNYPLTPSDGKIPLCLLSGAVLFCRFCSDSSQYSCIITAPPPNGSLWLGNYMYKRP